MREPFLRLYVKIASLKDAFIENDSGQDLIDCTLLVALIALAAVVGINSVVTTALGNRQQWVGLVF